MGQNERNTAKTLRKVAGVKGSVGAEIFPEKSAGIIRRPEEGVEITITPKIKPV